MDLEKCKEKKWASGVMIFHCSVMQCVVGETDDSLDRMVACYDLLDFSPSLTGFCFS